MGQGSKYEASESGVGIGALTWFSALLLGLNR
jgi:hypothetical protein